MRGELLPKPTGSFFQIKASYPFVFPVMRMMVMLFDKEREGVSVVKGELKSQSAE